MNRKEFITSVLAAACIPSVLASPTKFDDVKQEYFNQVKSLLVRFGYEENNAEIRRNIETALADHFYDFMKEHNVIIHENKFICDETNNPSECIDNNELHVSIGIREQASPNFRVFSFYILKTGGKWTDIC